MSQTLRAQWKSSLQFLKRSDLRKQGNPLYVLPWYLMMGGPDAGKTTSLRSARLSSFGEGSAKPKEGPTTSCDWSFFEQAIVMDTAGRYVLPDTDGADEQDWQCLLKLLAQTRRREPLNGLVLSISAQSLLADSHDRLRERAKVLRKRLDDVMEMTGSKIPVYVLVTRCDVLPGMTRFCDQLSNHGRDQAMGYINEDSHQDVSAFVEKAFLTIGNRLRRVRLVLAAQPEASTMDPEVVTFPESFGKLQSGAQAMLAHVFEESPYQETPFLRGLYFASSGYFLHDFFAKVLPTDRSLATPTRQAISWRRGTMHTGIVAWLAFSALLASTMSVAFVRNMKTLHVLREAERDFSDAYATPLPMKGKIQAMVRLDQVLSEVDEKNRQNHLLSFGFQSASGLPATLSDKLSHHFRQELLGPLDDTYRSEMNSMTAGSSDDRFSRYVAHLVGRLHLLRERLNGNGVGGTGRSAPLIPYLKVNGRETESEVKEQVGHLYVQYVTSSADTAGLRNEMAALEAQLRRLLNLKGRDPRWLIAWAAAQNTVPSVTLGELWGGQARSSREGSVPGLFTAQGRVLIEQFFKEIDGALNDARVSSELKTRFERWYQENALIAWRDLVASFPQGIHTLQTPEAWRRLVPRMPGGASPYAVLSAQVLDQFQSASGTDMPSWVTHIRDIQDLHRTPAYLKYRLALEKVAKAVADPSQAVQTTAQVFDGTQPASGTLWGSAFDALSKLKATAPRGLANDSMVWTLVSGPLEFLWEGARLETADRLQSEWQTKVLAAATGLGGAQAMPVLVAKDGPAMRFAKEQAAPYMQWRPGTGFCGKEMFGGSVPLTAGFYSFLNGAVWASSVTNLQVSVTALSPEPNANAKRIPHVSRLTLRCGGKDRDQILQSRRWRVLESSFDAMEKTFTWSDACHETLLEIDIAGNHLAKSYPGSYGFFAFLHDFKSGQHTFYRTDFPDQAGALAELGVDSITMHYRLKGAPDFAAPKAAPASIVRGWSR